MKDQNINKAFSSLNEYESPIDPLKVWSQLEDKINVKPKRHFLLWTWLSIAIIAIASILYFLTTDGVSLDQDLPSAQILEEGSIFLPEHDHLLRDGKHNHADAVAIMTPESNRQQDSASPHASALNKDRIRLSDSDDLIAMALTSESIPERAEGLASDTVNEIRAVLHDSDNNPIQVDLGLKRAADDDQYRDTHPVVSSPQYLDKLAIYDDVNHEDISVNPVVPQEADRSTASYDIRLLERSPLRILEYQSAIPKRSWRPDLRRRRDNAFHIALRPYGSYQHALHEHQYTRDATGRLNSGDDHGSFYYGYAYGLEMIAKTPLGIDVIMGFNRSKIVDQLSYTVEREEQITLTNIVKDIYINANMDSVVIYGDTTVNAIITENGLLLNRYETIDIPIGIEVSTMRGAIEVGLSATALINITHQASVSRLNDGRQIENLDPLYKRKLGLRYRLSVPIQYHFSEHFSLGLRPSFIYNPGSLVKADSDISHGMHKLSAGMFTTYAF